MDLRVYVDGVARIICDLTRTTTVHDIIIALAQYKRKAGRYSLIQRAPDGTEKTLSPHELTCELIHHPDWSYILQQNPSNRQTSFHQKRSKSLDRQQTIVEKILPITSSTDYIQTKRSNNHQTLVSNESPILQKHLLCTSTENSLEHHSRPKSTIPSSLTENSAFHIIHNSFNIQQQRQKYLNLIEILKNQEYQFEQQEKDLNEKQKEIDYRELILYQSQLYQDSIQHELDLLDKYDQELFSQCQLLTQEYSSEKFDYELEYEKNLHFNYEHLQQQLTRCSTTLEQKRQLQEQLQYNIEQIHHDIQQIQININNDKKDILQHEYDFERSNSLLKQQEDLEYILIKRTEDINRFIQQQQKQILEMEMEIELIQMNNLHSSYHFHPTSSSDILMPVHLQVMNSTLLKLCPSGIWV